MKCRALGSSDLMCDSVASSCSNQGIKGWYGIQIGGESSTSPSQPLPIVLNPNIKITPNLVNYNDHKNLGPFCKNDHRRMQKTCISMGVLKSRRKRTRNIQIGLMRKY